MSWKNIVESFLELFRKKEYYSVDYEELNTYSLEFTILDDSFLPRIKEIILQFNEAKILEDKSAELILNESISYKKIDSLLHNIKEIVSKDYSKTYFESSKNNWDFNYFLSYPKNIHKDVLFISNRIKKSLIIEEQSSIIYPILAIKKKSGKYYLWNLLDDYDNLDDE